MQEKSENFNRIRPTLFEKCIKNSAGIGLNYYFSDPWFSQDLKSKFEANRSLGSCVINKQTHKQRLLLYIYDCLQSHADLGGFSPKTYMPLPLERSCIRPSFSSNNSLCLNDQINFSIEIKLYIYKRYRLINNHFLYKKKQ